MRFVIWGNVRPFTCFAALFIAATELALVRGVSSLYTDRTNMNTLRWTLGVISVLIGGGAVALLLVSNGFRRSFGASENNPLLAILPLAAIALLFAALVWPLNKFLLHAGAVAAVALVAFCVWQMITESATILWLALVYLGLWFVFYGSKVFGASTVSNGAS